MDLKADFVKQGVYLRNWTPRTATLYRQVLAHVPEPAKPELDAWVIALRERGVSAMGCNVHIRATNSFLTWLHEEGHLTTKLRLKLLPTHLKIPHIPSDNDLKRVLRLRTTRPGRLRARALVLLLADTGLRITEAIELPWKDVNLDDLMLTIHGKGGRWRQVPISETGRKALWPLRDKRLPFAPLNYRNAYRDIKGICGSAGVSGSQVRPHAFRHYFAVGYIRNGGDIYRLSRILGHSSISTTQIYLRSLGVEAVREAHTAFSPLSRL